MAQHRIAGMTHRILGSLIMLTTAVCLAGCSHISLDKSKGGNATGPGPNNSAKMPVQQSNEPLTGDWQIGFQFQNQTLQSNVHLQQRGNQFSGTGTDVQSGMPFKIEQGDLQGNQISFYKRYTNGKAPSIQYQGTMENVNTADYSGPYLSGDYTAAGKGTIASDRWEAEMIASSGASSQTSAPPAQPEPPVQPSPPPSHSFNGRAPDLSGKWKVGFEYNFKTIHGTMFLEQNGDRIGGHGVDDETHESFVIAQGWYHFPKLTIVRKYMKPKFKPTKKNKTPPMVPDRSMTFKAQVSMVDDKDYQGPYLEGKTQGGGAWQAEQVK